MTSTDMASQLSLTHCVMVIYLGSLMLHSFEKDFSPDAIHSSGEILVAGGIAAGSVHEVLLTCL